MKRDTKWKIKSSFKFLPDKLYLQIFYFFVFKKFINFKNPKTFNEKMQWLKINDRKDIYTTMVDKYEVKNYVASIIGEDYIIPTLGIYDSFDEIDFDKLPNQFVLKCTHDSNGLLIVNDKTKIDVQSVKKKIEEYLKRNYYYSGREWPYKNVKPRIIIEKYMGNNLSDYKMYCFNGKVKTTLVCSDRQENLKETFFDNEWNLMSLKRPNRDVDINIKKPKNFTLMMDLAEKLSKNISFLRVDFYEINGRVYFGELTFYPASGLSKYEPKEWDIKMGNWIVLPSKENYIYQQNYCVDYEK